MSSEPIKAQKNETTTYDCHPIKADTTHLRVIADHCRNLTPSCFKKEASRSETFMKKTVANLVSIFNMNCTEFACVFEGYTTHF